MGPMASNNAVFNCHLFYGVLVFVLYRCILKQFIDKQEII